MNCSLEQPVLRRCFPQRKQRIPKRLRDDTGQRPQIWRFRFLTTAYAQPLRKKSNWPKAFAGILK